MGVPSKISPDNIRDSIVEVKYVGKFPFEIIMGYFYQVLQSDFKFANKVPTKRKVTSPTVMEGVPQEIFFALNNSPVFLYNEKIKIQFQQNSIIFNCLEEYVLWKNYKPQILSVLAKIHSTNVISSYERVGLRYISEYQGMDIVDKIRFTYPLGTINKSIVNTGFKTEFFEEDFKVILNLNLNSIMPPFEGKDITDANNYLSLIDIDVIREKLQTQNIDVVFDIIEKAHAIEKNLFFNCVMKKEFIETLNPEY